jgi:hypothetical protein
VYNVGLIAVKDVINDRKYSWSKDTVINMMIIFFFILTGVRPYGIL